MNRNKQVVASVECNGPIDIVFDSIDQAESHFRNLLGVIPSKRCNIGIAVHGGRKAYGMYWRFIDRPGKILKPKAKSINYKYPKNR